MKLLPPPYGWPNGRALTLVADGPVDPALLTQFGCPASVAVKAVACLASSGEYSCRVTEPTAQRVEQCLWMFVRAKVGVILEDLEHAEEVREIWRQAAGVAPKFVVYLTSD